MKFSEKDIREIAGRLGDSMDRYGFYNTSILERAARVEAAIDVGARDKICVRGVFRPPIEVNFYIDYHRRVIEHHKPDYEKPFWVKVCLPGEKDLNAFVVGANCVKLIQPGFEYSRRDSEGNYLHGLFIRSPDVDIISLIERLRGFSKGEPISEDVIPDLSQPFEE